MQDSRYKSFRLINHININNKLITEINILKLNNKNLRLEINKLKTEILKLNSNQNNIQNKFDELSLLIDIILDYKIN